METLQREKLSHQAEGSFRKAEKRVGADQGLAESRLLKRAVCISTTGADRSGRPVKVLSPEMQKVFGDFDGKISFQRSPTRWVSPGRVDRATEFVKALSR